MESTLEIANMWTLSEARVLINALQPHAKELGFHVCLGGGVLNAGLSKKDLDLYFLPMDNGKIAASSEKLLAFLEDTWGKSKPMFNPRKLSLHDQITFHLDTTGRRHVVEEKPDYPEEKNSVYSVKRKFTYSGLRVDVFILGGGTVPQTAQVEKVEPTAVDIEATPGEMIYVGLHRNPEIAFTAGRREGRAMTYQDIIRWDNPLTQAAENLPAAPAPHPYRQEYMAPPNPRTRG